METHMENGDNVEMNNMLCDLIDIHKVSGNEDALQRVLRSIYSLLDSNNDVKFSTKLFDKLISVVIVDLGDANVTHERIAKVLDAVRIHARQSPASGSYLVRKLSSIALCEPTNMGGGDQLVPLHPYAGQIMEHFLDDFVRELGLKTACSPQLFVVLQRLLQSELGENRKVAYAIMRKLLGIVERCKENPGTSQLEALQCMQPHWTAYIVIMEQLEKPESNLVLPMLSGHLPRFVARCYDDNWLRWLRILYIRLLENQNTLVVRWTIEYLLMYSTINELRRVDLLDLFLDSTNKAELYDAEDYFLPEVNIKMFVQNSGTLQFLEALVAVSWQSLPLLHWLRSMQPRQPHISKSLLLKICGRIKSLQHENLRYEAQNRMFDIFEPTIESLSLGDYIQFIKALCDSFCRDHKRFTAKIASCTNILDEMVYFDKSVFMMIYRGDVNIGIELHKQMSKLPKVQHGWWRLFSFFFSLKLELETEKSEILKFYHKEYELDIEIFENMADLKDLQRYVNDKLNCESEEEISFVMHRCVDWFTTEKITKWSQIEELNLNPHELVAQGTILTVQRVASLLNDVESRFNDESILKVLMNFLRQYPDSVLIAAGLVKYAATFMPPEESERILSDVLEVSQFLNFSVVSCIKSVPIPLIIRGIISGSPLSGAKCIEYGYLISQYNYFFTSCRKRDSYINFVIDRRSDIIAVIDELLRINNQMVQSNVIYLENSKDHRIKMRIARALLRITFKNPGYWSDQLWDVVLALDEHENIKYMFECLVARCLPSVDVLLNRLIQLDALESSQQISLISVLHIYCLNKYNHVKPEQLQRIIDLLLPQTMSNDFETRLFTQLVLHRLLQQFEDSNIKLPGVTNMKNAIEGNLGDKLQEYEDEGRLLLPKICYQTPDGLQAADFILYMTYAPCDEYFAGSLRPNIKLKSELAKFRNIVREKGEIQFSLS